MSNEWPFGWDPSWERVGATSNAEYFVDHEGWLLCLPYIGSMDDQKAARDNLSFQLAWMDGHPDGPRVVAVFFDRMVSQNREARMVYSHSPPDGWARAVVLVGGTALSRAMGMFLLGLSSPRVPLKMFPTLESAREWVAGLAREGT